MQRAGVIAQLFLGSPDCRKSCQAAKGVRLCCTHSWENQKRGAGLVTSQSPGTHKAICSPWEGTDGSKGFV